MSAPGDRTATSTSGLVFEAPAPGRWELETAHHGLRPLSPFIRHAYQRAFEGGIVEPLQRYGLPLATVEAEFVHGCLYMRPLAIGEKSGSTPKGPPPVFVMKLLTRLHPELRRRAKTAERVFTEHIWRDEVDRWFDHDRAEQITRNLAIQDVDVESLDDGALRSHLDRALIHFEISARRNLATHGGDLIPSGDLLAHCEDWGIDANDAAALLVGSSPGTVETAVMLRPVAAARRRHGLPATSFTTVDDVRALDDAAQAAVDAWLQVHRWRTITSDDLDRPTLAEVPSLQLSALLHAGEGLDTAEPDVAAVRSRVPAEHRATFDDLVVEARYGHRQREDIRGLCWNWPCGLVRRALLEVGRRLRATNRIHHIEHVVEFFPDELTAVMHGAIAPSAETLGERAAERDRIEAAPPPRFLGAEEADPPLDAFPAPMARATRAMLANLAADATPPPTPHATAAVTGVGIGATAYRGRACVVRDLMLSHELLQPGDVLVTPFTGPSINSLLPIVGALVVEEGGPFCHAAIVAREFGCTTVTGAHHATALIPHGADVEVDPVHGTVTLR
jgi:pyruvate,water dikinase